MVEGSVLTIDGEDVEFERPISKTVEFNDFVVVLLKLTGEDLEDYHKNVIAVDHDGTIRWKVQNVPERGGKNRPYSNIYTQDGSDLVAYNIPGMRYRVDTEDGTLIEGGFIR